MAKGEIRVSGDGYWEWYVRKDTSEEVQDGITGKYLFFSSNRTVLVDVAFDELLYHDFHMAKIILERGHAGADFVLCLYHLDDSRRHELANRHRFTKNLKYRYWKSEEATQRDTEERTHRWEEELMPDDGDGPGYPTLDS